MRQYLMRDKAYCYMFIEWKAFTLLQLYINVLEHA